MSVDVLEEKAVRKDRPTRVTFQKVPRKNFQQDVTQRVEAYFKTNGIAKSADRAMVSKTIVILTAWLGTWLLILFNAVPPVAMLGLALAHGFSAAMLGLNIGHDAVHGSYAKTPKGNRRLALLFNIAGANDYLWSVTHNIVHHT